MELPVHLNLRRLHPELPEALRVRAIDYQRRGFRRQTLLTSLLDPALFPAAEIVELYHERWELELGFDEIKTHTLERQETLRSRAPERVRQEIWGLAIGYNLVRLEMERAAALAGIPPIRISYRHALMAIRSFLASAWLASPGVLPQPPRVPCTRSSPCSSLPPRRPRRFPRAVKIKMSNYPRKPSPRRRPAVK